MSLNPTGICVYHATSLTLWSQGLMCIKPPRIVRVTGQFCSLYVIPMWYRDATATSAC